jgi:hypothetical protein
LYIDGLSAVIRGHFVGIDQHQVRR